MENNMLYRGWRPIRDHKPPFAFGGKPSAKELEMIPPTRFFDQLAFIGNVWVGCFVYETSQGLVLIDSLEPEEGYLDMLLAGLNELGHEPSEVIAVFITHGHGDHYGNCAYFKEKYGAKIYMSKRDEALAKDPNVRRPNGLGPIEFDADVYLEDKAEYRFGGASIKAFSTPGHTPGCMSFIMEVSDEGRPHKVALWGGTGVPAPGTARVFYISSSLRFKEICREEGVDGEISTHPFVDGSKERLALCRGIFNGIANPFVIGEEACARYQDMFTNLCLAAMERDANKTK